MLKRLAVALAVTLTVTLAVTACQTALPDDVTPPPENGDGSADGVTSEDLIDEALARGDIDEETALVYKVYAAFADPRLPEAFRGDDSQVFKSDVMDEVDLWFVEERLSPEAEEILLPFMTPPYYVGSWFDVQQRLRQQETGLDVQLVPPCAPWQEHCPLLAGWSHVGGQNVKVWYLTANEATDRPRAELVRDAMENDVWPKLTELMQRAPLSDAGLFNNGSDGRLDIALVDLPVYGYARRIVPPVLGCKAKPVYLAIRRTLPDDRLRATAAHEFMHAIQWSYNVHTFCLHPEYKWLMEATANWAIDYVYPDNNLEHEFARWFLDHPERSLDSGGNHAYGAYVFFFYLARGFSPHWIRHIWEATESHRSLEAVEEGLRRAGSTNFEERWPEFARRNVNEPPFDQYQRWDGLTARAKFEQEITLAMGAQRDLHELLEVSLPHLSTQYYRFSFGDDEIRSVAFYNGFSYRLALEELPLDDPVIGLVPKALSEQERHGRHVQALVKLEGQDWHVEDWTDTPISYFCRDVVGERIEELIVIFSNYEHRRGQPNFDLAEPLGEKPSLFASNMGCARWQGTAEVRYDWDDINVTESWSAQVEFTRFDAKAFFGLPPEFPAVLYVPKGTISWQITGGDGTCTVSGAYSLPVPETIFGSIATMNYLLPTATEAYRGYGFHGLNHIEDVPITWTCPPEEGGSYTVDYPADFNLYIDLYSDEYGLPGDPDRDWRVSDDGRTISATITNPPWPYSERWTRASWTFRAKPLD